MSVFYMKSLRGARGPSKWHRPVCSPVAHLDESPFGITAGQMSTATRGYGRTGRALARIAACLAASASFSFAVFAGGEAVMQWQGGDELAKWRPYQLSAVTNTAKGVVYDSTGADPVLHSPLFLNLRRRASTMS